MQALDQHQRVQGLHLFWNGVRDYIDFPGYSCYTKTVFHIEIVQYTCTISVFLRQAVPVPGMPLRPDEEMSDYSSTPPGLARGRGPSPSLLNSYGSELQASSVTGCFSTVCRPVCVSG